MILFCLMSGKLNAQGTNSVGNAPVEKGSYEFVVKQGENNVPVPGGTIVLNIDRTGKIVRSLYRELLGRSADMNPVQSSTTPVTKLECSSKSAELCFATADKRVTFCICKPTGVGGTARINYNYMRKSGELNAN